MDVWQTPCAQFIGAIDITPFSARCIGCSGEFCTAIRQNGVAWFLKREYPQGAGQGDHRQPHRGRAVRGGWQRPPALLVLCDASSHALRALVQAAGRQHFVRIWQDGWEAGSGQRRRTRRIFPHDRYHRACRSGAPA